MLRKQFEILRNINEKVHQRTQKWNFDAKLQIFLKLTGVGDWTLNNTNAQMWSKTKNLIATNITYTLNILTEFWTATLETQGI